MTGQRWPGCRCWGGSRSLRSAMEPPDSTSSARSTSSIGRRLRRARCWFFNLSGICGGELRVRRAEPGVTAAAAGDHYLVARGGALHPVAEVIAELVGPNDSFAIDLRSGASRARTGDLVSATHALSQLSYGPE